MNDKAKLNLQGRKFIYEEVKEQSIKTKSSLDVKDYLELYNQDTYDNILDMLMNSSKLNYYWQRYILKSRKKHVESLENMAAQIIKSIPPYEIQEYFEPEYWRVCSECGQWMKEGYCVDDHEYYCSDECLHKHYSEEEYEEMFNEDNAYYTEWY